jgi:hypothetical protein
LDGKYRNITVDVNRKNVSVIYRRGYTARSDPPPIDPRELLARERFLDAAAGDLPLDDIKVQANAAAVLRSGGARQVRVELKIDASRLSLTHADGRWQGSIDLMILCGDSNQDVVGKLEQRMTLNFDEARYAQQAMAGGIPYVVIVPVTGAATRVKVLVYDYGNDRLGTANVTLR